MKGWLLGFLLMMAPMVLPGCTQETTTPEPSPLPSPTEEAIATATARPTPAPTTTPSPTPEAPPGGATARITPPSLPVAPGALVVVSVEVVPGGVGLSAADLTLSFDPQGVRVISVEPGDLLGDNPIIGAKRVDQRVGEVRIALARVGKSETLTPRGVLVTVGLQAQEGAVPGTSLPLRLTRLTLVDQAFREISEVRLEDGQVRVLSP